MFQSSLVLLQIIYNAENKILKWVNLKLFQTNGVSLASVIIFSQMNLWLRPHCFRKRILLLSMPRSSRRKRILKYSDFFIMTRIKLIFSASSFILLWELILNSSNLNLWTAIAKFLRKFFQFQEENVRKSSQNEKKKR